MSIVVLVVLVACIAAVASKRPPRVEPGSVWVSMDRPRRTVKVLRVQGDRVAFCYVGQSAETIRLATWFVQNFVEVRRVTLRDSSE